MPESGSPVQKRILILLDYHLHSLLHVSHRILGVFLAGRQRSAGSCIAWSYHPIDDGYPNYWYQQLTSAGLLHQSTYHLFQFVDLFTGILHFGYRILDKKRSWKCKTLLSPRRQLRYFLSFYDIGLYTVVWSILCSSALLQSRNVEANLRDVHVKMLQSAVCVILTVTPSLPFSHDWSY